MNTKAKTFGSSLWNSIEKSVRNLTESSVRVYVVNFIWDPVFVIVRPLVRDSIWDSVKNSVKKLNENQNKV